MKRRKARLARHAEQYPRRSGSDKQLSGAPDPATDGGAVLVVCADRYRYSGIKPEFIRRVFRERPGKGAARHNGRYLLRVDIEIFKQLAAALTAHEVV